MSQNPLTHIESNEARRVPQYVQPRASIVERPEELILELEMPGVAKGALSVHIENNELVVTGDRSAHPLPGEVIHREIRPVSYKRTFELDPAIDATRIQARLDQGVVRLTLPKSEQVQPRRIEVTD